jgi:hypothetical protein
VDYSTGLQRAREIIQGYEIGTHYGGVLQLKQRAAELRGEADKYELYKFFAKKDDRFYFADPDNKQFSLPLSDFIEELERVDNWTNYHKAVKKDDEKILIESRGRFYDFLRSFLISNHAQLISVT